ncbi:B3/B4 domain-containing protein [Ancylomarina longa]|uniref:B3/B4 tRNA-binding domain-containing protein n=1 Tax=Ancylomarina longa TaxID=2487017 RepID=A0A434AX02_9BACT|nr:phenylalanine--tRNA ligase beta subunit-related protein [Ancylomarina longa]RUT79045.1 hypothetical protein DLK05_06090 [Ancylomarina longa]
MFKIEIEEKLKMTCPNLQLGAIECNVNMQTNCPKLWEEIKNYTERIENNLSFESIREISAIQNSRKAYRTIGKDPSRYRLSSEALLRRLVNKKGLYQINNVVDLLNLVSVHSGFSIGGYNADKIKGIIRFGIGEAHEVYQGIGRGILNIDKLPVFRDDISAFGSPTSDSPRTQIDDNCKRFLMIFISFQMENGLLEAMDFAQSLLVKYAQGNQFETCIL